ncbi:hypothetical protein [Streptomyces flaveolus]|uniref:hypothetical protein n=1 Tax=Streptomyces flaveolus TaxID=67297 RepID=UPI0036FB6A1D
MATHPLMAAACLGVLDELEEMDFTAFAARGERLGHALASLNGIGPMRDVRGRGFFYGAEVTPGQLWPVMEAAEERGSTPMSLSRETGVRWVVEPGSMAGWPTCCGMT